jgi:hypothetical protein
VYLSRIPAHRKLKWCRKAAFGFSDGHETYVQFLSDHHPEEKTATLHPDDFVFLSFSDETRISRHSFVAFGQLTRE